MTHIPAHLARFDWYAPHLAWLRALGHATRHDPGVAKPVRADLCDADLSNADLRGAYLSGADLSNADLRDADLRGADLSGARGIASAGPVGRHRRIIYAVRHTGAVMVQAGCRWDTADAVRAAIQRDYAGDPRLTAYLAALDFVVAAVSVETP